MADVCEMSSADESMIETLNPARKEELRKLEEADMGPIAGQGMRW